MKQARGDYVGFLDDECIVLPNWLEVITADINEVAPLIIGGPYIGALLPESTPPKWFKPEYGDAYFLTEHLTRGYQKDFRASAGNMILHRSVCEGQQFERSFGPKGNDMKLGEETIFQEHFLTKHKGRMIFYEPCMEVIHYILPHKMSLSYRARRAMETGAATYRIKPFALSFDFAGALLHLTLLPFRVGLRDRTAYPYWQNYIYEKVIPRVMPVFGAILEKLRRRYL
jgi:hypothetical protein